MMLESEGGAKNITDISQNTIENLYTALKTISSRNQALTQFIGNYRQLSRLPLPQKKEIRVTEMLAEIEELYREPCARKGIAFTYHPGPDKLSIQADDSQILQVLINLVKNATEALEGIPNPTLNLVVKRILNQVSIEISDNGSGIPDEVLKKIFVPFYSTKPTGSGIGLSLSRQIIRNHSGQISVQSKEGEGTTLKVALPVK